MPTLTIFPTVAAYSKDEITLDAPAIIDLIRNESAPNKDMLRLLKLATFRPIPPPKGKRFVCQRTNANMVLITGIEGDYDGEQTSFDDAAALLRDAGIASIIYTSPSHTPEKPRWRVLCLLSQAHPASERERFVKRLNGVLGGILGLESFTASQSFYFGYTTDHSVHRKTLAPIPPSQPHFRIEEISGDFIDLLHSLDETARGKSSKQKANGHADTFQQDRVPLDELIETVTSGGDFHNTLGVIVGRMSLERWPKQLCIDIVYGAWRAACRVRADLEDRWERDALPFINTIYDKDEAKRSEAAEVITADDFLFQSKENKYIFRSTGELWSAAAVDGRLPWVGRVRPTTIIKQTKAVEQTSWVPGEPKLIRHRLVIKAGWRRHPNATVFNLYDPPDVIEGDASRAGPWLDHVRFVYPDEADHIIGWLAHRVQRPNQKLQHALLLGGTQGIGKDTMLYPVVFAVGPWNVESVTPQQAMGRFNGFLQSVLLIVSEARDLGEINRPQFYEHFKNIICSTAAPVHRIDEKNTKEYYVPNLNSVIITTNHKAGGIYLPAEDRRHLVAWSPRTLADFSVDYFKKLYRFYSTGIGHVVAYLRSFNLNTFDPEAPPPRTQAFYEIVNAGVQPEMTDLMEAIHQLGDPDIVTVNDVTGVLLSAVEGQLAQTLRTNRRMLPRWFEQCGYRFVSNPGNKQGLWLIDGKLQAVYGKISLSTNDLMRAIAARKAR